MFTLGHISDWHATALAGVSPLELANKRFFGWLSYHIGRRKRHRPEVLEALFDDLRAQRPDHVAVTGDLTHVALEQEFRESAEQLRALGPPDWISLIPGNHDAYVSVSAERSLDHWAAYLRSDDAAGPEGVAPLADDHPTLRVREPVALLGVSTSQPTPLFQASGRVGEAQLQRLERQLTELRERELCRVVLIHHPVTPAGQSARRRLRDQAAFRDVIARVGAELVLHGHTHRDAHSTLPGPDGGVPVLGVRSSSEIGSRAAKRSRYHLYRIEAAGSRWRIERSARELASDGGSFEEVDTRELAAV